MEYCDHLDNEGKFVDRDQKDTYLASGDGQETFINKFNYHGFRYVKISNLTVKPAKEAITAYLIHTDYYMSSDFECSDNDMNRIHDMIFYTLRCLSLGGYLVDCPQIERLGYGGDGNASTETAQMMFGLGPLYSNWLQAWGDCIREDGGMPHTAPNPYAAGGGPYWCGFIISASWKTYLSFGDTLILEKYYPVMKKWLGYVEKYSLTGLLKRWPDTDYRVWYLGDWASPEGVNEKSENSIDLVSNSFVCMCYDYMQKIAEVIGKTDDIQQFSIKRDKLKKLVHQTYYKADSKTYAEGTQIDLCFPLLAGIVPDSLISKVKENLSFEIENNHKGHIACGLVGIPVFTEWAVENNASQLVYSMLKKRDYPGYLYMIDNGATTTWEEWKNSRSYIHNCFNGIGAWFYQAPGGIRMDKDYPAWNHVIIDPQIPDGITWANTTKETPYGPVRVNWKIDGALFKMQLDIPVGVKSKIIIPEGVLKYTLNDEDYDLKQELEFIEILSGKYYFSCILKQ
jgi:alpha-L-rhamnosidase